MVRRAAGRLRAVLGVFRGRTPPSPVAEPPVVAWWQELRPTGWWDLFPFSAHRIALAPGRFTMEGEGVDADHDVRTAIVCRELGEALAGSTVVDLGCLEGGFSIALATRGAGLVVGIEARQLSVDRCNLVRDFAHLTNVEFRCADLHEELARWPAGFDAVLAAGILYHLPDPARSLVVIRAACRGFALIDTHVAVPDRPTHSCSAEIVELRSGGATYSGRTFREFDETAPPEDREAYLWAAHDHSEVFWPFEEDLVRMMTAAGFATVTKLDPTTVEGRWQVDALNRAMYLCRV